MVLNWASFCTSYRNTTNEKNKGRFRSPFPTERRGLTVIGWIRTKTKLHYLKAAIKSGAALNYLREGGRRTDGTDGTDRTRRSLHCGRAPPRSGCPLQPPKPPGRPAGLSACVREGSRNAEAPTLRSRTVAATSLALDAHWF